MIKGIDKLSPQEKNLIINLMYREKFLKKKKLDKNLEFKHVKTIEDFNGFFLMNNIDIVIYKKKNLLDIRSKNKKYIINFSQYKLLNQNEKTIIHTLNFSMKEQKLYKKIKSSKFNIEEFIEMHEIQKKYLGKNGLNKKRKIYIINDNEMKSILKKLNLYLSMIYINLNKNKENYNYAYQKKKSYNEYLSIHKGAKQALHLDLKNFFSSITNKMMRDRFNELGMEKSIIDIIIKLTTIRNEENINVLMQGNPLAPMISNFIFSKIDSCLYDICSNNGVKYSRYSDDLLFSSNNNEVKEIKKFIKPIIESNGFKLNEDKERYMEKEIIISSIRIKEDGLYIKSSFLKEINTLILNLEKYYLYDKLDEKEFEKITEKIFKQKLNKTIIDKDINQIMKKLKGKIEYANNVNKFHYPIIKSIVKYNNLCKIIKNKIQEFIPLIRNNVPVFSNTILIYNENLEKKYYCVYKKNKNFRIDIKKNENLKKVYIIQEGKYRKVTIYPKEKYSIDGNTYYKYLRTKNYIEFEDYSKLIIEKIKINLDNDVVLENKNKLEKQLSYVKRNING